MSISRGCHVVSLRYTQITLIETHFSIICYHTLFQDPLLTLASFFQHDFVSLVLLHVVGNG